MVKKNYSNLMSPLALGLFLILSGCGTTLSGYVVQPDGSKLKNPDVVVYTDPWTDSVRVDKDGSFKIRKNVMEKNEYTIVAEDREGNTGYIRGYKPQEGKNENLVLRLSREVSGKDAVMEGGLIDVQPTGTGEKIFKSSQ